MIIHHLTLDIDMRLMGLLKRIDRFDAEWPAIEKRESMTVKELKSIATIKSVGASTRIEGSRMTDDEVAVLIGRLKKSNLEERDEQEVAGYYEVLDAVIGNHGGIDISESVLKSLHKMLLRHAEKDAWHRGDYKQVSNAVEARMEDGVRRTIFRTTEPGLPTTIAMGELMDWYHNDIDTLPLIKTAVFVYEFLSIHPFQDGNGRLSRLLTTLMLLKNGYAWIQYVSFEQEIEKRKSEYYSILMETQRERPGENVTPWVSFFADCLMELQRQLSVRMESTLKTEVSTPREKRIVACIENHPGSSSGQIAERLGIPLPTVKKSLAGLVLRGVLFKEGRLKSTVYYIA